MSHYVLGEDGARYGPADAQTLRQWASEDRIRPDTLLESSETGAVCPARDVQEIFPTAPPPSFAAPPGMDPQNPYYRNPEAFAHYSAPSAAQAGEKDIQNAWISFAIGLVLCGMFGFALGWYYAARAGKHPSARLPLILNIVFLSLSVIGTITLVVFAIATL